MVRAFHWQYGDILLAIYFFVFTYYFVLSLKNKYTILLGQGCTCQTRGRLGNLGHLEGVLGGCWLRLSGHAEMKSSSGRQVNESRSSESFSVGSSVLFSVSCS